MKLKRIVSSILALAMVATLISTVAMAASTSATVMTLEKTEGYFYVKNAAGKYTTVRDGGRLYSGYQLRTGAGYMWVKLDDNKLIKLDWYTKVTIIKNDNQLEILVECGEIFFDVSQSLESDETLAIRTSTMYSGIRGTAGTVSVRTEEVEDETGIQSTVQSSTLTVYEGVVAATTLSTEDNSTTTELVSAAQQATASAVVTPEGANDVTLEVNDVSIPAAMESSAYVIQEIAENETLKTRVEEASVEAGNDTVAEELEQVIENAQTILETKEESATTQEQTVTQTIEEAQTALADTASGTNVESVFEVPATTTTTTTTTTTKPDTSDIPDDVEIYTVTYRYETGSIDFATLEVESGSYAVDTVVIPTPAGYWSADGTTAFAFTSTPIIADITLTWVAIST